MSTTEATRMRVSTQIDLASLVRLFASDTASWRPYVRFDPGGRYWKRLARREGLDLWLLTWLPEQMTELHDHGDSSASFVVIQGQLEEVRVAPTGAFSHAVLREGDAVDVPARTVHDVANRSTSPAVSIHAYSPRLEQMTFWAPVAHGLRRLHTVATDEPEL